MYVLTIIFLIFLLNFNTLFAVGELFDFQTDVKIIGLGYNSVSLIDEKTGIIDNPASLSSLDYMEFSFSQNFLQDNLSLSTIKFGLPIKSHTFGVRTSYFQLPDFKEIVFGESTGNILSFKEYLITLTYSIDIKKILSFGLNARYYNSTLGVETGKAIAFDTGIILPLRFPNLSNKNNKNLAIGVAVKNLAANIKYRETEKINLIYKTGFSYKIIEKLTFAYSIDYNNKYYGNNLGVEYNMLSFLTLRAGSSFGNQSYSFTGGTTLEYRVEKIFFSVNYAFAYHNFIGTTHHISVSFKTIPYYKLVSMGLASIKKLHILNVAILDFLNKNNNPEYEYFASTISESIGTYILKEKKINLLTRKKIKNLLKGYALNIDTIENLSELKKLAKKLNVNILILGYFEAQENEVKIKNVLYNAQANKIELTKDYEGKIDLTIFDLLDSISEDNLNTITEYLNK